MHQDYEEPNTIMVKAIPRKVKMHKDAQQWPSLPPLDTSLEKQELISTLTLCLCNSKASIKLEKTYSRLHLSHRLEEGASRRLGGGQGEGKRRVKIRIGEGKERIG